MDDPKPPTDPTTPATTPTGNAPPDAARILNPPTSSEPGTMKMRNVMNGEIVDAEPLGGKDAYGRVKYRPRAGFEPVGNHTVDVDGTWLEVVTPKTGSPRAQIMAQSGAPAIVSDEDQAKLEEDTKKVAAKRAGAATGEAPPNGPSDTIVGQDGTVIHAPEGTHDEGTSDLGANLQTGKKRGR